MSKLFNYLALLLIVLSFASCQEKKAEANVPKWILSMVSDSKNTSAETDFSNILSDKSVPYIGYIGTDYQKFSIDIQKVQRTMIINTMSAVLPLSRTIVVTSVEPLISLRIGNLHILRMV